MAQSQKTIPKVKLAAELDALNTRLNEVNEKLKEADRLKDEFLSIASHELRTPMTAIKGYLWLLLRETAEPLPPKAREYLERVYASNERLIQMVNDMLDVSRITSGKIRVTKQVLNVVTLAQEMHQMFLGRAMEKQLTIRVHARTEVPLLHADREKIRQVLENLLGNAIKFTPEGGTITMTIQKKRNAVLIAVKDTGIGMQKNDIPKLFKKFGRIDNSLVPLPGVGTGLGLYICKQFVELHHGKISVASISGKGSTFTVSLPFSQRKK